MMLARLVQLARLGENLPPATTIEQRICLLFVNAGAEVRGGRPLSLTDLRALTNGIAEVSLAWTLAKLLKRGCVTRFTRRGMYLINFDGEWPEDGRGKSEGSVQARTSKRNPRAAMPFSVNTLKGGRG